MTTTIVRFSPRSEDLQRLQVGPIGPHLPSFVTLVAQQGYCNVTGWLKIRLVAKLSRWLLQHRVAQWRTAMNLLQHGVDRSVIAMWLGHESTDTMQMYLHADIELKEKALAKTEPFRGRSRRYRPADQLLAFLQAL